MKAEGYVHILDTALSFADEGKTTEANLEISNFFYRNGAVSRKELADALKFTLHYRPYGQANLRVRSHIAKCLLMVKRLSESDGIYVKKTGEEYEIVEV